MLSINDTHFLVIKSHYTVPSFALSISSLLQPHLSLHYAENMKGKLCFTLLSKKLQS